MNLVCLECLTDHYLQQFFADNDSDECSYCSKELPVVELDELASHCENFILDAFQLVEQSDAVIHYNRDPVGDPLPVVLERMLRAPEAILDDLTIALLKIWSEWPDEDLFFIEQTFVSSHMDSEWRKMERSLRDEARFVNPLASRMLEKVFGSIDQFRAPDQSTAILTVGPNEPIRTFQRARVFSDADEMAKALLHPERHLGPPPSGVGAAGRMNAKGVSVFYGATNDEIAIAEVRPPVGSLVVTATFEVIRPLRLLNLEHLSLIQPSSELSYFDPARQDEAQRCAFLKALENTLLMPVMPELVDQGYLITQAIADFLSTHPSLAVDGIFFPSVQHAKNVGHAIGHNVILFNKASGVLKSELKYQASSVSLWEHEEGYSRYRPEIWAGSEHSSPLRRSSDVRLMVALASSIAPSLELDRTRICIHHVEGVKFTTKADAVEYHQDAEENSG
ncbi:RES family NAD+ phosphorylase [Pseudomonas sp. MDT1-16]